MQPVAGCLRLYQDSYTGQEYMLPISNLHEAIHKV